jgi:hypothetical protein
MSFSRAFQWYHSYADPIWPDGTFNKGFRINLISAGSISLDSSFIVYNTDTVIKFNLIKEYVENL